MPTDVKAMRELIEASLLSTGEKRERRKAEISLMENRAGVEALYNRLRTAGKYPYIPSLSAFRDLPVIAMIQTTDRTTKAANSVTDVLNSNPVMADLLKTQLAKWTEKAKQDLGVVLGFPRNWKNANKNVLHPVERVTGRFQCTRCERVDVKYRNDGSLDFAGACRHECGVGNEKKGRIRKGKKWKWDSSIFAKDEKAGLFSSGCLSFRNSRLFSRRSKFSNVVLNCRATLKTGMGETTCSKLAVVRCAILVTHRWS
jgi:hypothetical protein